MCTCDSILCVPLTLMYSSIPVAQHNNNTSLHTLIACENNYIYIYGELVHTHDCSRSISLSISIRRALRGIYCVWWCYMCYLYITVLSPKVHFNFVIMHANISNYLFTLLSFSISTSCTQCVRQSVCGHGRWSM